LTLPFAALGALVAALIETTVLPMFPIAGATINLVLVLAVVATMTMGVEDGLVWAFVGGLMLDMLTPERPLGATTLTLLVVVGVAALAARLFAPGRRLPAVVATFVLTGAFHLGLLAVLRLTEGLDLGALQPRVVFVAAILNLLVAVPAVMAFTVVDRRFGTAERPDW
jgi:rod shape-determining protein MreD